MSNSELTRMANDFVKSLLTARITDKIESIIPDKVPEATEEECDKIFARFRQTDPALQEKIIASFVARASRAEAFLLRLAKEHQKFMRIHHEFLWHEDDGTVIWWNNNMEPEFIGSPLDSDWPKDKEYKLWSYIGGNSDDRPRCPATGMLQ